MILILLTVCTQFSGGAAGPEPYSAARVPSTKAAEGEFAPPLPTSPANTLNHKIRDLEARVEILSGGQDEAVGEMRNMLKGRMFRICFYAHRLTFGIEYSQI